MRVVALLSAGFVAGCTLLYGDFPGDGALDLGGGVGGGDCGCDAPPANICLDSTALRAFVPKGSCTDTGCSYAYYDVICQKGCKDGACIGGDPCDGITCIDPPSASCLDGSTLRRYSSSGTCA